MTKTKGPRCYDVFNGDADGICALHQLRLAEPRKATLITGVKRDIKLLEKLAGVNEAEITVLDVSLDSNRKALLALLDRGCSINYIDHHFAGDIPDHEKLSTNINTNPDTCTSLIVDEQLGGRYRKWAVAAAFGDNQHPAALRAAAAIHLAEDEIAKLRELGELLNYNGYGATVKDLHFLPDKLYEALHVYEDPLDFFEQSEVLHQLRAGHNDDMNQAMQIETMHNRENGRIFSFPDAAWSRRVAGVYINRRAREQKEKGHALLVDNGDGSFMVSVRSPLDNKTGADGLCRKFPTGGGRAAAAGINKLPQNMIDDFVKAFFEVF